MSAAGLDARIGAILAALRAGQAAAALADAEAAAAAHPDDPRVHALTARASLALGDADRAERAVGRALALDPDSVPSWVEAAAIARLQGDRARLREALSRLVALAPGHAPFHLDLATLEGLEGRLDAAEHALDRAVAAAPRDLVARLARANLRLRRGALAEALADADAACALAPADPRALLAASEVLMRLGRAADAVVRLERAVAGEPTSWVLHDALLRALKQAGAPAPRILAQAERLGEILGGGFGASMVAVERLVMGGPEFGAEAIARALAAHPEHPMPNWLAMNVPPSMVHDDEAAEAAFLANWRARLAWFEALDLSRVAPVEAQAMLYAASPFYVHYLGEPLVDELRRLGRLMSALAERAAGPLETPPRPDDGRLRIGIGSGMLRHHTVTKLFGALIEAIDRQRFELTLIHTGSHEDEVTRRLIAASDAYLRIPGSLADVARAVRERDLDLIVWLDIGMETTGAALAALRLAPVQAMLWGHPVTSGLPSIDHVLSVASMEPADGDAHYVERLHRLPGIGTCYRPPAGAAVELPAEFHGERPPGTLVFMPQTAQKLRPRFDRALAAITARAPAIRFLMTPFFRDAPVARYQARLGRAFEREGLQLSDHLALCRWVRQSEWLGLARIADFALDAFDWSGGNTSLEMLWFDTPIVTLPGRLMRSRHTMAMLDLLELPELIARDEQDYVRIAVELATSADFRAEMRGRIRERKHRLYEDRAVIDAFWAFCREQAEAGRARRLSRAGGGAG